MTKHILISFEDYPASAVSITLRRRPHTCDGRMQESPNLLADRVQNLMTGLFCHCAARTTGVSTRLAKRIFGWIASPSYGRSHYSQSAEIMPKERKSLKRHFGLPI